MMEAAVRAVPAAAEVLEEGAAALASHLCCKRPASMPA